MNDAVYVPLALLVTVGDLIVTPSAGGVTVRVKTSSPSSCKLPNASRAWTMKSKTSPPTPAYLHTSSVGLNVVASANTSACRTVTVVSAVAFISIPPKVPTRSYVPATVGTKFTSYVPSSLSTSEAVTF